MRYTFTTQYEGNLTIRRKQKIRDTYENNMLANDCDLLSSTNETNVLELCIDNDDDLPLAT